MRKTGDIDKWYSIFNDIRNSVLSDVLETPEDQADLFPKE